MQEIKHKTNTVTIPNGTVAGTYERVVDSDSDFTQIEGVAAYEVANGGTDYYRLGLKFDQGSKVVQEVTHKNNWIGNVAVPIEEHYKTASIPAASTKYRLVIQIPTNLTADLVIDLVFKQVREAC